MDMDTDKICMGPPRYYSHRKTHRNWTSHYEIIGVGTYIPNIKIYNIIFSLF